jgi:branched-subunit amino acid transport protein
VSDFLAILAVGLGTYASRAVFIVALAKRRIPDPVAVALSYVAPSVIGALIVALLIDTDGSVLIGGPELAGFAVGGLVAYLTRSHTLTLIAGMGAYWLARALT